MTALEQYRERPAEVATLPQFTDPTGGRLVAWAQAASAAHNLASALVKTSFAPKEFRGKPDEAAAAILLGDELGLSPISALRSVYVIHGTPSIYAKTAVALVQSHGHDVWTEEQSDTRVVMGGRRKGSDRPESAVWTIERARKAGYTSNAKYQSSPQEMLWAKAASEICKKIASDVLAGVPLTVEDLELEPENQPKVTVARAPRRVQRQAPPSPPEPEFESPPEVSSQQESEPGITDAQSKKLHALLREAGITDRDTGLAYIGDIIGREIGSSKELTRAEASRAIDQIATEKEPLDPPAEPALDGDWPPVTTPGGDR